MKHYKIWFGFDNALTTTTTDGSISGQDDPCLLLANVV